jgi:hypothetical protein
MGSFMYDGERPDPARLLHESGYKRQRTGSLVYDEERPMGRSCRTENALWTRGQRTLECAR